MTRSLRVSTAATFCLILAATLSAQSNRTAVSANGLDTNPCSVASPCRTFGAAVLLTNDGGEVIALDSAGYGMFTITRPMSVIVPPGIYAGIIPVYNPPTQNNAVSVLMATPGTVVLRGLSLRDYYSGGAAIHFDGAGSNLHIESCDAMGFSPNGSIRVSADTTITDTVVRYGGVGIQIRNPGAPVRAVIDSCLFLANNGNAVLVRENASVVIRNSVAIGSNNHGFSSADATARANIENCLSTDNVSMGFSCSYGLMRISNSVSTGNGLGVVANYGGTVELWGNNKVRGNTTDKSSTYFSPGTMTSISQQ